MISAEPQPDQRPQNWDDHVSVYETVFEPFSLQFAEAAIDRLHLQVGQHVLDVGAGSGGAALALAARGAKVTAVDASMAMCARIAARAAAQGVPITAAAMDGQNLALADDSFDAALSVFGVILFPDAVRGLAEMRRVVRPGGRVAVVTWTQPEAYELAAALRAATAAIRPTPPSGALPAQLRYREQSDFAALFRSAGFGEPTLSVQSAHLHAPSARWLASRIGFAPGMAATLAGLGSDADAVLARLVTDLEARHGAGALSLGGKAFVGSAVVPAGAHL